LSSQPDNEYPNSQFDDVEGLQEAMEGFPDLFAGLKPEEVSDMVLSNIITVEDTLAADNADFLAGTQLDQPGQAGVYTIWAVSTVGDTLMSITLGGQQITNNAVLTLRANSEIRENEDTFFQMLAVGTGRPVININVVTAAIVRVRVKFLPAGVI